MKKIKAIFVCVRSCVSPLLTGGVIDPLDMCWWVLFKVTEDVLCAHVVHADDVDGLQARLGNRWGEQDRVRTTTEV